jgi:hypothetical protein
VPQGVLTKEELVMKAICLLPYSILINACTYIDKDCNYKGTRTFAD